MKRFVFFASVVLALAVLALYAGVRGFEFVRLDDHDYTFLCPFVKGGLAWSNVCAAFTNLRHAAIWMPVTYVTYMCDVTFWGAGRDAMGPHHVVNVLLHALNAVLFFILLLRIFARRCRTDRWAVACCLLAVAFWALHPLRVEPTAWVAGRKELLCGLFTLLGLLAWVSGRPVWGWVCCALACLSKPTAMCFPFLAASVAFLARGEEEQPAPRPRAWWAAYLPLLLIAAATGLVAIYSQTHAAGYDARALYTASFALRLENAVAALGGYLFQTFVPWGLHVDVPFPVGGVPAAWLARAAAGFAMLLALALAATLLARPDARRGVLRGGFWSLLFLLFAVAPVLGLFGSFGRAAHADRFTYLPGMAVSFFLVLAAASARGRRFCAVAVLGALVLGTAAFTPSLAGTWRNDFTLFSRVLACSPDHARALSHVASEECARFGRFDAGIAHFRASLKKEWNESTAGQLAFALVTRGKHADADEVRYCCRTALKNPAADRKGLMLEALGQVSLWERKWSEAAGWFALAVQAPARLHPADDAQVRLGVALANAGRTGEAERIFAALASPGVVHDRARQFAERALEQLGNNTTVMLFY